MASYAKLASHADALVGFELSDVFAPFGKIYSMDVYRGLLGIDRLIGSKHSSLNRELEWQRLLLRDELRPEFHVFTGNDLAIDMVMYGSDYLLGLSTFAPDVFARRDAAWAAGDPAFYELNDWLQYLGFLTFRPPVPAYKHSAAMFLKLRGQIECDTRTRNRPNVRKATATFCGTSWNKCPRHECAVQADANSVVEDGGRVSRARGFWESRFLVRMKSQEAIPHWPTVDGAHGKRQNPRQPDCTASDGGLGWHGRWRGDGSHAPALAAVWREWREIDLRRGSHGGAAGWTRQSESADH